MTNTPYIAFALVGQLFSLINNRNVDIAYSKCINYLKLLSVKDKKLLKTIYLVKPPLIHFKRTVVGSAHSSSEIDMSQAFQFSKFRTEWPY